MFCELCKQKKLRREFPSKTLTDKCNHAVLHCLRCVTREVRDESKCSQCPQHVTTDNPAYREFMKTLEWLFPASPHCLTEPEEAVPEDNDQTISVFMLGGDSTVLEYNPNMTIQDMKLVVEEKLGPLPDDQRLIYKEQELKSYKESTLTTVQDYSIKPFSILHLVVVLYNIPESLDHVIFDLFWGYPTGRRDYLDASVLIYSNHRLKQIADYKYQKGFNGAVDHSGDVMDDENSLGHHTIEVKLKSLPTNIDKLFFTLSAWNSPNISKYKNPRLHFYDARKRDTQLCSDQMEHAAHSQAIIMCCLSKIEGAWKVFSLRTLSAGNAKDYTPLEQKINGIISQGLC